MKELNIGNIKIPVEYATKSFALLAKRGAGKTYTGAVFAEELADKNIPFIAIDPIDVWWGLRLAADGKGKGLPVVVFGIEHADILIDRDMGKKIAQAIVRENISCVISTFGMPKVAQRHLVAEFCEELLRINNTPRHVFIEEAHEFVPQRVMGGLGKTFAAVEALVVMGRNRGIGVTLLNQRAATVNKDVLTQVDGLLVFRNTSPQDRKALSEWVEAHAAEGDFKKFFASLPSLPTGEGWLWSPEFMETFQKIKIRPRNTFHPDREKLGTNFEMPNIEQADIQSFIEKFGKSVKKEKKPSRDYTLEKLGFGMDKARGTGVAPEPIPEHLRYVPQPSEEEILRSELDRAKAEIIRQANIITAITKLVSENNTKPQENSSSNANVWIDKLGRNRAEGKILSFLADNSPLKFSRGQIAIRTALSPNSSGFQMAMSYLKKNGLIVVEGTDYKISPNL